MARYRKVDVRIHSDEKFRQLSGPPPCGKYLWLYLITGPHTGPIPGLFRAGQAAMAEELDWDLEGFREAFQEAFQKGMVKADWKAKLVWLPNALKYNPPASPNVVKSWANAWDELPECALKNEAFQEIKAFLEGFGKAFAKAFAKAYANQEQEQEQEQDIQTCGVGDAGAVATVDQLELTPTKPDPPPKRSDDVAEVWSHYRTHHPKAPRLLKSNRKERRLILERLQDFTVDDLKAAIDGYHADPWYRGHNDRGKAFLQLEMMVRSVGQVQRGIELAEGHAKSNGRAPPNLLDHPLAQEDISH
jgi:hypothetical protein